MEGLAIRRDDSSLCYSPLELYSIPDIKAFVSKRKRIVLGYIEKRAIALLYRNRISEISVDGLAKLLGVSRYTAKDMLVRWWSYGWAKYIDIDKYVVKWECIPRDVIKRCLKYLDGVSASSSISEMGKRVLAYLYRNSVLYIAFEEYIDRVPRDGKAVSDRELAESLGMSIEQIHRLMFRWGNRGFLKRISRAIYRVEWDKIPRYMIDIALLESGGNGDG